MASKTLQLIIQKCNLHFKIVYTVDVCILPENKGLYSPHCILRKLRMAPMFVTVFVTDKAFQPSVILLGIFGSYEENE